MNAMLSALIAMRRIQVQMNVGAECFAVDCDQMSSTIDPPRCKLSSCVIDVDVCFSASMIRSKAVSDLFHAVDAFLRQVTYQMNVCFDLSKLVYCSVSLPTFIKQ
jgi:hypothetical protein